MSVLQTLCRRLAPLCLLMLSMIAHGATLADRLRRDARGHRSRQPHRDDDRARRAHLHCPAGRALRVVKNGALLSQPFLTVSVDSSGERGLLGVAFDPNFASNSFVYVYYTTSASPIHNRVSRFTASAANPDVVAAGSEVQLLNLPSLSSATNHNGGAIHFGTDGKLYIAVGENANGANSQSLNNHAGQGAAHQLRWLDSLGQPLPESNYRHQPGDLGDRPAQSVHVRDRSHQRPHPCQRRRPGHLGRGQPGRCRFQLRMAADRGSQPGGRRGRALPDSHLPERGGFCAITGAAFYRPVTATFPPDTRAAISSAISAAASSAR